MPRDIEVLHGPGQRGPTTLRDESNRAAWFGRTDIASGDASAVVSTALVNSDSVIMYGVQNHIAQTSGSVVNNIEVTTISPGVSFTVGYADGLARNTGGTTTVMWELKRR